MSSVDKYRPLGTGRACQPIGPPPRLPQSLLRPPVLWLIWRFALTLLVLTVAFELIAEGLGLDRLHPARSWLVLLAAAGAGGVVFWAWRRWNRDRAGLAEMWSGAVSTPAGYAVLPLEPGEQRAQGVVVLEQESPRAVSAVYSYIRDLWTPSSGWSREDLRVERICLEEVPNGPLDVLEIVHEPSGEREELVFLYPLLVFQNAQAVMTHLLAHGANGIELQPVIYEVAFSGAGKVGNVYAELLPAS